MKKIMTIAIAALACVALAEGPEAGSKFMGPRRGGPGGPGTHGPRMAERGGGVPNDPAVAAVMNPKVVEKLGLSDEVKAKIKKLDADSKAALATMQKKTRDVMEKQAKLMREVKPDEAAVMSVIDELFELRKEMAKTQTRRMIEIKSLLTPEQLEAATAAMKELRDSQRSKRVNGPKSEMPEKKD